MPSVFKEIVYLFMKLLLFSSSLTFYEKYTVLLKLTSMILLFLHFFSSLLSDIPSNSSGTSVDPLYHNSVSHQTTMLQHTS